MIHERATTRPAPAAAFLGFFIGCVLAAATAAGAAGAGALGVVPSADGTPVAYEVHGNGEPTLILVHGWSCDARYWREQLAHFAAGYEDFDWTWRR